MIIEVSYVTSPPNNRMAHALGARVVDRHEIYFLRIPLGRWDKTVMLPDKEPQP